MKTATEISERYRQSENRILRWQEEYGTCPPKHYYDWKTPTIVWPQPHGEGKKHSYGMRWAMKKGMTLERALELQLEHVRDRGETLEGYTKYYAALGRPCRAEWVTKTWEADTEWLNTLVRAALLKNTGHSPGDVETILKNRAFFEQVRTKGVTR